MDNYHDGSMIARVSQCRGCRDCFTTNNFPGLEAVVIGFSQLTTTCRPGKIRKFTRTRIYCCFFRTIVLSLNRFTKTNLANRITKYGA